MYKTAAILYVIGLVCYILFSRVPDFFDAEFTPGKVLQLKSLEKQIQYKVGKETFVVPISGWGASQVANGQTITVIYNPTVPSEGALYTFFAYWFTLDELLTSAIGFILLFVVAVLITGKNSEESYVEEEAPRKRKYND
jgi:hypothetical protein